jgi:protoporphyrinogen oxidase
VPRPTLEQVVRGALGIPNRGMGYNATFRYPARGGIGILAQALARRVDRLRLGARVERIDLDRREVILASGERLGYHALVSTLPLPDLLGRLVGAGAEELGQEARRLDWSVVACWNLGVSQTDLADGAHWLYFPDADTPFYRAGFPTNFSRAVAPPGTGSMYIEFGLRRDEPLDRERLEREALGALRREGILDRATRVLVSDWIRIDPGYVIFDRARRAVVPHVLDRLARRGIHAIGRYGAWTYSYMERALLDGLETATRLTDGDDGR